MSGPCRRTRTRASDTERERVVERLRDAAAQGRLTVEELDERTETAYGAVTRGELAELLDVRRAFAGLQD